MEMNKRMDLIQNLLVLLNLSEEPYEGGEFYLIASPDKRQKFDSGDGTNFTVAHKVTPVTKG